LPVDKLVTKARDGDIDAFEKLIATSQGKIYNLALRLTGNRHDADDLAQEAVLRVYRALSSFRQEASFDTWVYQIVSNLYKDSLRQKARLKEEQIDFAYKTQRGEVSRQIASDMPDPVEIYENHELGNYLQSCINNLNPEYRFVIVLREYMQYSYEEIAEILNISIGTVKSRLSRGRKYLQQQIIADQEQMHTPISLNKKAR